MSMYALDDSTARPYLPSREFIRGVIRSSAVMSSVGAEISDSEIDKLIERCAPLVFVSGQTIIAQGSTEQRDLYIIADGSVDVNISHHDDPPVKIGAVRVGDMIGDSALYTDAPPSSSIVASSTTYALRIPKSAFDEFISAHKVLATSLAERRWIWSTLSKVAQFRKLDDDVAKEQLVSRFKRRRVDQGHVIIQHGDAGDDFYIIEEGECEIRVPYNITAQHIDDIPNATDTKADSDAVGLASEPSPSSPPLPLSYEDNGQSTLADSVVGDVRVAIKGPADSFGELALLYNVSRCATVRCITSHCSLWSVDGASFRAACTAGSLYLKKIFFEFASTTDPNSGEKLMTDKDFFNAIRRTQAKHISKSTSRRKERDKEDDNAELSERQLKLLFHLADQSGDNLISFSEFVLLNSIIRGPFPKYQIAFRMFDRNKSGTIERDEFIQVIRALAHDQSKSIDLSRDQFIRDLFGDESSKRQLSYAQFEQLLQRDALPSFLSNVRADLREIDTAMVRVNQTWSSDSNPIVKSSGSLSWKALVAGGLAGAVSRTIVSPLERVKLLFQMQGNPPKYTGTLQALRLIFKEDGIYGFFRGNLSNVIRITPTSALQFAFFDFYKAAIFPNKTSAELNPLERLFCGGNAGITACILTYPLDLIRARLTLQSKSHLQYTGIIDGLRQVVRNEGVVGLYRGLWPSIVGIYPYIGIDFAVYETLRGQVPQGELWRTPHGDPRKHVLLACGAIAGVVGQTIAYPLDLVRRRMQVQGWGQANGANYAYRGGITRTMMEIIRTEGVTALYRGLIPNYYKVVPAVSISFVVYEQCREVLDEVKV